MNAKTITYRGAVWSNGKKYSNVETVYHVVLTIAELYANYELLQPLIALAICNGSAMDEEFYISDPGGDGSVLYKNEAWDIRSAEADTPVYIQLAHVTEMQQLLEFLKERNEALEDVQQQLQSK